MPSACLKLLWASPAAAFQAYWVVPRANVPHRVNFRPSPNWLDSANSKAIIGYFSCVHRNHKNTINKLLKHVSNGALTPITYTLLFLAPTVIKTIEVRLRKVIPLIAYFFSIQRKLRFAIIEYEFDSLSLRGENIRQISTVYSNNQLGIINI